VTPKQRHSTLQVVKITLKKRRLKKGQGKKLFEFHFKEMTTRTDPLASGAIFKQSNQQQLRANTPLFGPTYRSPTPAQTFNMWTSPSLVPSPQGIYPGSSMYPNAYRSTVSPAQFQQHHNTMLHPSPPGVSASPPKPKPQTNTPVLSTNEQKHIRTEFMRYLMTSPAPILNGGESEYPVTSTTEQQQQIQKQTYPQNNVHESVNNSTTPSDVMNTSTDSNEKIVTFSHWYFKFMKHSTTFSHEIRLYVSGLVPQDVQNDESEVWLNSAALANKLDDNTVKSVTETIYNLSHGFDAELFSKENELILNERPFLAFSFSQGIMPDDWQVLLQSAHESEEESTSEDKKPVEEEQEQIIEVETDETWLDAQIERMKNIEDINIVKRIIEQMKQIENEIAPEEKIQTFSQGTQTKQLELVEQSTWTTEDNMSQEEEDSNQYEESKPTYVERSTWTKEDDMEEEEEESKPTYAEMSTWTKEDDMQDEEDEQEEEILPPEPSKPKLVEKSTWTNEDNMSQEEETASPSRSRKTTFKKYAQENLEDEEYPVLVMQTQEEPSTPPETLTTVIPYTPDLTHAIEAFQNTNGNDSYLETGNYEEDEWYGSSQLLDPPSQKQVDESGEYETRTIVVGSLNDFNEMLETTDKKKDVSEKTKGRVTRKKEDEEEEDEDYKFEEEDEEYKFEEEKEEESGDDENDEEYKFEGNVSSEEDEMKSRGKKRKRVQNSSQKSKRRKVEDDDEQVEDSSPTQHTDDSVVEIYTPNMTRSGRKTTRPLHYWSNERKVNGKEGGTLLVSSHDYTPAYSGTEYTTRRTESMRGGRDRNKYNEGTKDMRYKPLKVDSSDDSDYDPSQPETKKKKRSNSQKKKKED
jgi:hypothetical protein